MKCYMLPTDQQTLINW